MRLVSDVSELSEVRYTTKGRAFTLCLPEAALHGFRCGTQAAIACIDAAQNGDGVAVETTTTGVDSCIDEEDMNTASHRGYDAQQALALTAGEHACSKPVIRIVG